MQKKFWFLLFFIVFAALFLRLYKLGSIPISPDWDEVALGYNAYSVIHTGRDEFGKFLPIVLRSFDDYKPALYAYLSIPFIKIFGLNVFAVRFASAILGVLTVLATFFLIQELFWEDSQKKKTIFLALFTSFLLAISPWSIQFSRVAFEANAGLAFNIFGVLFFLKGLRISKYLILSAIFAATSLYTYQGEKVFVPLIFFALVIIFQKKLFGISKKYLLLTSIIGLVIALPIILFTFESRGALSRARGVSFLSDKQPIIKVNQERLSIDKREADTIGLIIDQPSIAYGKKILQSYLSHFDLNWLFIKSDSIARHHAPFMGNLYLFELPFLLLGIYVLFFGAYKRNTKIFIFLWFFIAPIPAAITNDVPHSVRTINFLPTFQIFTAIGIITAYIWIKKKKVYLRFSVTLFVLLLFFSNFLYYSNQYFVQQNYYTALDWEYGYKNLIDFVLPMKQNYKKIIASNKEVFDQSYIFFLFYSRYNPSLYLASGGTLSQRLEGGGNRFANFEFRPFDYSREKNGETLFIGSPSDFSGEVKAIKIINYPNGKTAMKVVQGS